MDQLPAELQTVVAGKISTVSDLLNLLQISKRYREKGKSDKFWRYLHDSKFGTDDEITDYKRAYISKMLEPLFLTNLESIDEFVSEFIISVIVDYYPDKSDEQIDELEKKIVEYVKNYLQDHDIKIIFNDFYVTEDQKNSVTAVNVDIMVSTIILMVLKKFGVPETPVYYLAFWNNYLFDAMDELFYSLTIKKIQDVHYVAKGEIVPEELDPEYDYDRLMRINDRIYKLMR